MLSCIHRFSTASVTSTAAITFAALARTAVMLASGVLANGTVQAQEAVKVGLVAALTGNSALSGEAVTRGITIAIDEINMRGGVLGGRKLVLVRRDDESGPSKGQLAARELIEKEGVAIVFGGIDTPVSAALVNVMQELKRPYMGVWAAGTSITRNGKKPNYMFCVSAVDERVDLAMLRYAQKAYASKKTGAILVNNSWGESNQHSLEKASTELALPLANAEGVKLLNVMAEVQAAFARYEKALTHNEVGALDHLFCDRANTVRYGAAENLVGYAEIRAFCAVRPAADLARILYTTATTIYGRDCATACIEFTRNGIPRVGRQTQAWILTGDGRKVGAAHVSVIDSP